MIKFFEHLIMTAKRKPIPVVAPKSNPDSMKFKPDVLNAPMGPEAFLATRNQPSGAHKTEDQKTKNKQKIKNQLRKLQDPNDF